jgi:hypothetical protein
MTCATQFATIPVSENKVIQTTPNVCQNECTFNYNCYAYGQTNQNGLTSIQATCATNALEAAGQFSLSESSLFKTTNNMCVYYGYNPGFYSYTVSIPNVKP